MVGFFRWPSDAFVITGLKQAMKDQSAPEGSLGHEGHQPSPVATDGLLPDS